MTTALILSMMPGYFGISRLPKSLKSKGIKVIVLAPSDSYIASTSYIDHLYTFQSNTEYARVFYNIIRNHRVDILIPGGDLDIMFLKQLIGSSFSILRAKLKIKKLLRLSVGSGNSLTVLSNKSLFQTNMSKLNIPSPNNVLVYSKKDLEEEMKKRKFPVVLKLDFGASGSNVRICYDTNELQSSWLELSSKSKIKLSQKIINIGKILMGLPKMSGSQVVSIQNYIEGNICYHSVFASKGKVLSEFSVKTLKSNPEKTGPSSVVEVIDNQEISANISKVIKKLEYSGFACFDYILDNQNISYMLECNPRPTAITHLSDKCGANLIDAMLFHLGNVKEFEDQLKVEYPVIALFPNEIRRDVNSEYIAKYYHDIPLDDECLRIKLMGNCN